MTTHRIRIAQVFRVEREILVDIEAASLFGAIELQSQGDGPAFGDPRWESRWSLENEGVDPA